jgi:hypothetical protein|uniref:Uncharacterized protein n=1 Tax=Bacteriophage sp. TaxID=38018 RepID=A0A8D9PEQ0_9VIRU|nr:MAG TPA: hypothetical protein [Bacteriophage sp.]
MEWFEFEKKRPHIGEEILVAKIFFNDTKIFIATYLGRKRVDSEEMFDVKLDNFKKYIQKDYSSQYHYFLSSCLRWTRLN